ncbi:hypothetical protein AXG93_17s1080 [Marchantia polymorpha subsp. ruderalis]|uniref:Uncharacterized protein n=1 Tax=Marchantia polymorpha subsp. ruderalis TaxID=1480154 RepID=A0A176VGD6_MARPO|nr:hypothetical protein AXG93_17s1080 [Marchantia polymorpha subsp. ruderalis]
MNDPLAHPGAVPSPGQRGEKQEERLLLESWKKAARPSRLRFDTAALRCRVGGAQACRPSGDERRAVESVGGEDARKKKRSSSLIEPGSRGVEK